MFVCLSVSEIQVYWDADASKKRGVLKLHSTITVTDREVGRQSRGQTYRVTDIQKDINTGRMMHKKGNL